MQARHARPLHVVHVDSGREWRGGQAQVLGLLGALQGRPGLRLTLCAPAGSPLASRASERGIDVFHLPLRGELDFRSPRLLRAWITAQAADIVHGHDAHAHTIALRAVRPLPQVRLVVHRRVDFPISGGWIGQRKYGARVDHFIAISEAVARALAGGGVPSEKITVIHSGVDPAKFDGAPAGPPVRHVLGIPPDAPVIGTVGALVDHKGHRFLIAAMRSVLARCPAAHCVIVGEGELRPALERQIRAEGLAERVHLAGWREDIAQCLDAFTVFCLPSHLEGLCTSLLDATLRRVPIVAAAAGGVPEILIDGETGWLVPVRDPDALARALLDALSRREEARRRAEHALRRTLEHFTLASMANATLALWLKVAGRERLGC